MTTITIDTRDTFTPDGVDMDRDRLRAVIRQWSRVSGIKNSANMHARPVTATGRETRTMPDTLGLPPMTVMQTPDLSDVRAARYRMNLRGEAYAKAAQRSAAARVNAFWKAASPWVPLDKAGRMRSGTVTATGMVYILGDEIHSLRDLQLAHIARETAYAERVAREGREAEIARLRDEQDLDAKAQRRGKAAC